jgi:hypothetical protein
VMTAPATRTGKKQSAKERAEAPVNATPVRAAFRQIDARPTGAATAAAISHVSSQACDPIVKVPPTTAAASPTRPMPTPPHPETAVNRVDRSMVERMKRRLSSACSPKSCWFIGTIMGCAAVGVKYFVVQSSVGKAMESEIGGTS